MFLTFCSFVSWVTEQHHFDGWPLDYTFVVTLTVCLYCLRYSTATAESDYTDRDTDRETDKEAEREPEEDSDEDKSCATTITLRQEDSQEEGEEPQEEDEDNEDDDEEEMLEVMAEVPSGELALLLAQSDILHTGDARLKAEGFHLLLANKLQVSPNDMSLRMWIFCGKFCFHVAEVKIFFCSVATSVIFCFFVIPVWRQQGVSMATGPCLQ